VSIEIRIIKTILLLLMFHKITPCTVERCTLKKKIIHIIVTFTSQSEQYKYI